MSDGFLSRWARRKRAVRAAERRLPDAQAAEPEADGSGADPETLTTGEALPPAATSTALDADPAAPAAEDPLANLPPLDALTPHSDLAPFLRAGVPTAVRNAALRRMWSLDPAIRDFVSEAREYAYDWNSPGGVPGLGPLLPGDDVKAMLRRLVGALPEEADAALTAQHMPPVTLPTERGPARIPLASAEAEQTRLGIGEAGSRVSEDQERGATRQTESELRRPAETELESGLPAPGPPSGQASPTEGQGRAQVAHPPRASAPTAQPRARLRRHGGAMPG